MHLLMLYVYIFYYALPTDWLECAFVINTRVSQEYLSYVLSQDLEDIDV